MTFRCIRCNAPIDPSVKTCPQCGEPVTDFLRKYLQEPIDGKYEILERLGVGGMGEVYKVRHTFLGTTRVVKVIRANISDSAKGEERFLREARLATRVQHPNVATLHDFSALPDGSQYMVWEYIDGENLAQRLKAFGKLMPRQAVRIAIQTLHGLEAIHRAGIVHRDISPENIMLTRDGEERVKIIDLGVAKATEGEGITQQGMFIGKLKYASPEHLGLLPEGERIDGRADLYSLAVVLYEMLTGRAPFEAKTPRDYLLLHSKATEFKPLDLPPNVPGGAELQQVMERGFERDRNKRFSSAAEFAAALGNVERKASETAKPSTEPGRTVVQPLPVAPPPPPPHASAPKAPPTVVDRPAATAPPTEAATAPVPKRPLPLGVLGALIGVLLLAIVAMLFFLLRPSSKTEVATTTETAATTTTQAEVPPPPPPSTTTAEAVVDTATQTATDTVATSTETTTAPTTTTQAPPPTPPTETVAPKREVKKKEKRPPKPAPAPPPPTPVEPEPAPAPAPVVVQRYIENGNGDANGAAIAATRRELGSPSQIAIRGGGDSDQTTKLVNLVKSQVGVSDSASVVVQFDGKIERRAFGRKVRSTTATISKDGQVVFRYELAPQVYRVGDDPAEAFARVLLQALGK